MSAFARYGIERLSPSSLNCWISSPGIWALRYLGGLKEEGNASMWRGSAVEAGLHRILLGMGLEHAVGDMYEEYDQRCQGEVSDLIEKEAKLLEPMLKVAHDWYTQIPGEVSLAATQLKVETRLDGVSIPIIGYLDFTFMEGPDIDCKTTKACPSKPRPDHVRQLALYWQARRRPQSLLYITDKKYAHYVVPEEDLRQGIVDLTRAAQSLERFLTFVPDADTAIRSLPMDTESFMFSDAARLKLAQLNEVF
jgi:hypothetical protein